MSTQPEPVVEPQADLQLPPSGEDPIAELEALLEAEHRFLGCLNVAGIDAIAERKELLLPRLAEAQTQVGDADRLARIRQMALHNQLLTVHVRDVVGSIVGAAQGVAGAGSYRPRAGGAPQAPRGVRLSVKG